LGNPEKFKISIEIKLDIKKYKAKIFKDGSEEACSYLCDDVKQTSNKNLGVVCTSTTNCMKSRFKMDLKETTFRNRMLLLRHNK
uniref:Uncharacterized protein n=1 Tax=Romanomermis culicivorax TaxID=13658 RepID=A0A915J5Y1_ROMCU